MDLERTKIALFAEDLYDDHTLWYPLYRLRENSPKYVGSFLDALCSSTP